MVIKAGLSLGKKLISLTKTCKTGSCKPKIGKCASQTSGNASMDKFVTSRFKSLGFEAKNFIKANLSKDFSDINEKELNCLIKNITQNSNNDINIIKKRLDVVNAQQHLYIYDLFEESHENAGFILDNFDSVKKIFKHKGFWQLGPDNKELTKLISKDNLQDIIKHINTNTKDFEKYVSKLIYDSKPHNIKLGNETVKIDSSEIISLLSETQSPSYFKTGSSVSFNKAINTLTEVTHRVDSDDICPYYKLAEGILVQKPELAQIAKTYKQYIEKRGNNDIVSYMNDFFDNLEKSGQLTKQIELKTIVPDENALICQSKLLDIFIERHTK